MTDIHPLAQVDSTAEIDETAHIEAFAVVRGQVRLGPHARIKAHAFVEGRTSIGEATVIWPGACVGTPPQDLKYRGAETEVHIGANCVIRECATINRATKDGERVSIADRCLIMAYAHIAHDCQLEEGVILSNGATLAGHVTVESYAVVGGMSAVHQFTRIGTLAMVGGMSRVTRDVPPYTIGAGAPYRFGGLNLVGLGRRGVELDVRRQLACAFRNVFRSGLSLSAALTKIERECLPLPEIEHWVRFCRASQRGILGFEGARRAGDRAHSTGGI